MKFLRNQVILVTAFSVLLAACSSEKKLAGHMEKAETYMASGEYDKAEIELKNAIRLDTEGTDAVALLGRIYFEQGRLSRAAPILYRVGQKNPENLDNQVNLALAFLASGRPDEAHQAALAILEKRPTDDQAPIILAGTVSNTESIAETKSYLRTLESTGGPTAAIKMGLASLAFRSNDREAAEESIAEALALDPDFAPAYAVLGTLQWARGDKDAAKASLAKAAELSPVRSDRRIQYVRFLRQNGESAASKAYLDKIIKNAPDYLPALTLAAELAVADQKMDLASEYLDKALTLAPSHPNALELKGRLSLAQNKPLEGSETFERLLSLYPGNARIHHYLALAYLAQDEREKAFANLRQAVALAPDFSEAILLLAQLEIRSGGATDAILPLKTLVEKQPELSQARVLLAEAYRAQGNLDGALSVYRDLTTLFPDSPQGYLAEGLILMLQGNQQASRTAFESALNAAPDYMPAAEQLINLDLGVRDTDGAEARARTLVTSYPDRPEPHFLLARVLLASGDLTEAETSLQQAIAINPEARPPQMLMVNIYLQTGRSAKAAEKLLEIIDQSPDDVGALTLLAMTRQQLGDVTAAQSTYERILEINPDLVAALNNLAVIYSEEADRPEEAFGLAERARELAPDDPYSADTLGWIVYKRGDYDWAISLLSESVARMPNEPEVQFHLGMAHYMAGRTAEAADGLTAALALRDDFPGSETARVRLAILAIDPQIPDKRNREVLESTINDDPDDPVALTKLGNMAEHGDDLLAASEAYQQALNAQPEYVAAIVGLARLQEDPARALELARKAYKLDPNDPEVTSTVGRLAFESGEFAWAASVLQQAARRDPGDPRLAYDLARALYSVGKTQEARVQLEDVLAGDRFDEAKLMMEFVELAESPLDAAEQMDRIESILAENPRYVVALMARGAAHEETGDAIAAVEDYQAVISIYPEFSPAKRQLALLMADAPVDLDEAFSMASQARRAFPGDAEVAGALGKLAYLREDYRRAKTLLGEATRAESETAECWFYLGMAQVRSGDMEAGKATLEKAMKMGLPGNLFREAEVEVSGGQSSVDGAADRL